MKIKELIKFNDEMKKTTVYINYYIKTIIDDSIEEDDDNIVISILSLIKNKIEKLINELNEFENIDELLFNQIRDNYYNIINIRIKE